MAGPDARPDPKSLHVGPQTLLKWTITTGGAKPPPPINGESVVRADGMLDLGPYGSVSVGGLTAHEASDAIARHLAKHNLPGAHVHLTAYIRPETPAPAARSAPEAAPLTPNPAQTPPRNETPASPVTPTGYPAPPQTLSPAALQPTPPAVETAGPALVGIVPEQRPADKPAADKDKEADTGKKDQPAGAGEQDKTDQGSGVAAALEPPLPGPGPGPGHVANELHKVALPPYLIEPPDILLVEYLGEEPVFNREQAVRGQHLVRPDGTISLGIFGSVPVAGLTLEQARLAIYSKLAERSKATLNALSVDVLAYNTKVYYVITDGGGYGEQIFRFPITGSETVLDALALIGGLPPMSSKKRVWVARRTPGYGQSNILPVDYIGMTQGGLAGTNYQIMPGDRVYVHSDAWVRADTKIARFLSPIERLLGATLLGSETVNSIKNRGSGTGTGVR
jgi:polysaccharide export outer membrane protein